MIWQEDPAVLAMWDQRAHFGGWASICQCLHLIHTDELFQHGTNRAVLVWLDKFLAEHGPPPIAFRLAWLRDRWRCCRRWNLAESVEMREYLRQRFEGLRAMRRDVQVAIKAGAAA